MDGRDGVDGRDVADRRARHDRPGAGRHALGGAPRRAGLGRRATTLIVVGAVALAGAQVVAMDAARRAASSLIAAPAAGGTDRGRAGDPEPTASAAATPTPPVRGISAEERTAGIGAALAVLNQSLSTRRTDGLAALVPRGRRDLLNALTSDVEALLTVPFDSIEYRWTPERWSALDGTWNTLPEGSVVAHVDRVYSLGDPVPVVEELDLVMTPADGPWLIADKQEPTDDDLPEPWWAGPLEARRSGAVLVLGDPKDRAQLTRLAQVVEREWAATRAAWKLPDSAEHLVVYASRSPWFQQTWLDRSGAQVFRPDETDDAVAPTTFVGAVAPVDLAEPEVTRFAGPEPRVLRLTLGAQFVRAPTSFDAQAVIAHELVHVATGQIGTGQMVTWLTEGVADLGAGKRLLGRFDERALWLGYVPPASDARALRKRTWSPDLLPERADFYSGDPDEVSTHYYDALVALVYLEQEYGAKKIDTLVRAALDGGVSALGRRTALDTALREVLGTDVETLTRDVAQYGNAMARRYGVSTG